MIQDIDPRILIAIAMVAFTGLLVVVYYTFTERDK